LPEYLAVILAVVLIILVVAVVLLVLVVVLVAAAVLLVLVVLLIAAVVLTVVVAIEAHLLTSLFIMGIVCLNLRKAIHTKNSERKQAMLLIKNGLLHTMESKTPIRADILLKDGKIARIAKDIQPGENMEMLDAEGCGVYPGFIDAHSHIGISEEKKTLHTDSSNEGTNPITPCVRAIDAINPMDSAFHNALAAGITSVMAGPGSANPIGGQFALIKTDGRRIDDMVVLAPAAIKIAFGENPMTNYGMNGNMPSTRMGTAALIREELTKARRYFEENKGEYDFSMECYRGLFEGRIPLKAHVHRADDIFTAIRIAKEFGLKLTLDHCTEGHLIADEIADSGFPAIVGPSLASRSKDEVSQSDFKTPGILQKAGVTVALTTDHPVSRIQYLPLCAGLAAKEGMGEWEALRAVTIDAARICGVNDRLGSIKEGKDGDMVLYEGNPLEIASSVKATVINGKAVWKSDGK